MTPRIIQSMEFSRPEYWSDFPSPENLPNPGIEPWFPALQADSLPDEPHCIPPRFFFIWVFESLFVYPFHNGYIISLRTEIRATLAKSYYHEFDSFKRLPRWLSGKESACSAGDARDISSIPRMGRSSGGGNGSPLQSSCLGNPMDRGAWWVIVHEVAESDVTV